MEEWDARAEGLGEANNFLLYKLFALVKKQISQLSILIILHKQQILSSKDIFKLLTYHKKSQAKQMYFASILGII